MKRLSRLTACFSLITILTVGCSTAHHSTPTPQQDTTSVGAEIMSQLKSLVGHWEGESIKRGGTPEHATVDYALTSGDTVLVEKLFAGTPHEMVSVYHPDGENVLMTHYCMIGNQPRLQAKRLDGQTIEFSFQDGTNMRDPGELHMHQLKVSLLDHNNMRQEWTAYKDGRTMETTVFKFTRKE